MWIGVTSAMHQRDAAPVGTPKRRTQAQRSAATKDLLLAATVDCLYELGYHKTTTYSVEQRAGLTRGALLHHFPSKSTLLIAAAEYIVAVSERQLAAEGTEFSAADIGDELADWLWRQFTSRPYFAFLEICMAARTDSVLSDALARPQEVLDAHCREALAHLVGASSDDADFAMGVELSIRFMRGSAITAMLGERPEDHEIRRRWQRLVAPYFASAGTGRDGRLDGRPLLG